MTRGFLSNRFFASRSNNQISSFALTRILILLTLFMMVSGLYAADAEYVYDEAGRLSGVLSPNGDAARYNYDKAGNIENIVRTPSSQISILEFSPKKSRGPAGTMVTIRGTGFNPSAQANTVTFGGVIASVSTASVNTLVVTAPANAVTGLITVSNTLGTATSRDQFVVDNTAAPTILNFSPTIGTIGTEVTINGDNFGTSDATVTRFYDVVSAVNSLTATSMKAVVPNRAASGKISISTFSGSTISAADFFVLPPWYNASDFELKSRLAEGVTTAAQIPTPGKKAMFIFDGQKGDAYSLGITNISYPSGTSCSTLVKVFAPDGSQFYLGNAYYLIDANYDFAPLPSTGTYSVMIEPSAACSHSFSIVLAKAVVTSLQADGSTVNAATVAIGQDLRFTFDGQIGQYLTGYAIAVLTPSQAAGNITVTLLKPDGSYLYGLGFVPNSPILLDFPVLPASGTYTLVINPPISATVQAALSLTRAVAGTVATDGTLFSLNISNLGQNARLSFAGVQGQNLGISLSGMSFTPNGYAQICSADIKVYKPDGSLFAASGIAPFKSPAGNIDLVSLPTTGTYTLLIDPVDRCTLTANVQISTPIMAAVTANGGPVTVSTLFPGQDARITFNGAIGQTLSLYLSGITTSPTGNSVSILVYRPDGSQISLPYPSLITHGSFAIFDFPALTIAGVYSIVLNPPAGVTATTTLSLSEETTGNVLTDGTVSPMNISRVGQNARLSFNGVAGQVLGLSIGRATFANNGYTGTCSAKYATLKVEGTVPAWGWSGNSLSAPGATSDLITLPVSGIYTITIDPVDRCTLTADVSLNQAGSNVINVDGAAAAATSPSVGQATRYSFSGTSGQVLSLAATDVVVSPSTGSNSTIRVLGIDGATLSSTTTTNGLPAFLDLSALPTTGTYFVEVFPSGNATTTANLLLSSTLTGMVPTDGTVFPLNISRVGQNARLTFNGTVGQNLSVALTGTIFTKNGYAGTCVASGQIYKPDNSIMSSVAFYGPAESLDLALLPMSGIYTLIVNPTDRCTLSTNVQIGSPIAAAIVTNGDSVNVATTFPGQDARITFDGVAGQMVSLYVSGVTTSPAGGSVSVLILGPNNSSVISTSSSVSHGSAAVFDVTAPLVAGTYTIVLNPPAGATAAATLLVSAEVNGTVATDGTAFPLSIARVGQNARLSFDGVSGQVLTLKFAAATFVPNGYAGTCKADFYVYKPDNTYLTYAYSAIGAGETAINLPVLPTTGTYRIAVNPADRCTLASNVSLNLPGSGAITVNGATVSASMPTAGQAVRYNFAGTVGQYLSLAVTGVAVNPVTAGNVQIRILNPDTSTLIASSVGNGINALLDFPILPTTGTYVVELTPPAGATATANLLLSSVVTGTATTDGAILPLAITRVGQNARLTFAGTLGQNLSVAFTGMIFTANGYASTCSADIAVYKPDGSLLNSSNVLAPAGYVDLPTLPLSGAYSMTINPIDLCTLSANIQLSVSAASTVVVNAASSVTSTAFPAQNARINFDGTTGQLLNLYLSGVTTSPAAGSVAIAIIQPDGNTLTTLSVNDASFALVDLPVLAATGTYTIVLNPSSGAAATATVLLSTEVIGTLATTGTVLPLNISRIGQNARVTFAGVAGQVFGLSFGGVAFTSNGYAGSCDTAMTVYKPDSSMLQSMTLSAPGATWDLPALPASGNYAVAINPPDRCTLAANVSLNQAGTNAIAINGVQVAASSPTAGQAVRYNFTGTTGQYLSLAVTGMAVNPSTAGSAEIRVIRPDGTSLISSSAANGGYTVIDLPALTTTGTYTFEFVPPGSATASANVLLSAEATGPVNTNGTVFALSLARMAQNARLTFSGTAGQSFGISFGTAVFTANGYTGTCAATYNVLKPDGVALLSAANLTAPGTTTDLPVLPTTGTYTITIDPVDRCTLTANLSLNLAGTKTIAVNGTQITATTTSAGQAVRYSYSGTAGQYLSLAVTTVAVTPTTAGNITIRVLGTTGAVLATGTAANAGYTVIDFPVLPTTGTYNIELAPPGNATLSAKLSLSAVVTGTVATTGTVRALTVARVGQYARLQFTGTVGKVLTLGFASVVFTKNGYTGTCNAAVSVIKPDGTVLNNYTLSANTSYTLTALPVAGTYFISVNPIDRCTETANVTLK